LGTYKILSFDSLDSTQTKAHELIASAVADDRHVIIADEQIDGYGRYFRKWVSDTGNLYSSFIYNMENRDPRLSYSVAVAVADTLIKFGIMPQIKWPNDILINKKKICGILIEYSKRFVVVGIGLNIKSSPVLEKYETTKIADYDKDISKDDILPVLMKNLDFWIGQDFSAVKQKWSDLAIGLNQIIQYQNKNAKMIGINDSGALVLQIGSEYVTKYGDEISI